MTKRCALMLAIALSVAQSARARAQDTRDRARDLFERGTRSLDEHEYEVARDRLQGSLALQAHPATAYNLALALDGLGQRRAASEVLRNVLEGAYGAIDDERAREARRVLAQVRATLGTIVVRVDGAPEALVRLDGIAVGTLREGAVLALDADAGERRVSATASDARTVTRAVGVRAGSTTEVILSAPPPVRALRSAARARRSGRAREDADGDGAGAWPWLAASAAVVAAVAVVAVVLLAPPQPTRDPVFGDVEVLLGPLP